MNIAINGLHKLPLEHYSNKSAIYISGNFGTATVDIVKKSGFPVNESPITTNTSFSLEHGKGATLYLEVSGVSGSTSIDVDVYGSG
jgi:hypothetical protein|tara:strand:+ start:685 stop:942 length:258 start_codon:yes stop_codon:yes gene_type:complete